MRAFAVALVLLLTAVPAAAEFVVGVHGGFGAYTQEDLNTSLADFNVEAGDHVADQVKSGWEYGAHLGWRLNETTVVGAAYARLAADLSARADVGWLELSLPADCWLGFINWTPGEEDDPARLGLGADLGVVMVDGTTSSRITGFDQVDHAFEGDGVFISVYVVGDLALAGGMSLVAHGGFRMAQVPGTLVDGQDVNLDLDYSGVFGRIGLRFAP